MKTLQWFTSQRKINDLLPYENNPRILTDDKKEILKKSLEKFNLAEIPAINTDNTIIAGHQRIKVLQLIGRGEEMIDVRIPNRKLNQKEVKEYNITSNISIGIWDISILEDVFSNIDLKALGLNIDEIKMPDELGTNPIVLETEDDNFEIPEEVETDIVLGDLIEIGEHRLLCGDATNKQSINLLMGGGKSDMIFTDPPYNKKINSIGCKNSKKSIGKIHGEFKMASGEMNRKQFISFLSRVFNLLIKNSNDGSIHFICMDWRHIFELITAGQLYTELKNLCIWNKDNAGMGTFYRSKHELIFVFKNGDAKHVNNFELGQFGRYRTNVWDYPIVSSFGNATNIRVNNRSMGSEEQKMHPTVKPLKMVGDAILDCSNAGQIILDLFIGSGTTMVASEQLKRKCFAMEIEPKYCQVTINRMRKLNPEIIIKKNGSRLD